MGYAGDLQICRRGRTSSAVSRPGVTTDSKVLPLLVPVGEGRQGRTPSSAQMTGGQPLTTIEPGEAKYVSIRRSQTIQGRGLFMRAAVHHEYGPPEVLRREDVERPAPKADEVLIRIHATTVTRSDTGWRSGEPFLSRLYTGLRRPKKKILGCELAGEVEAVGAVGAAVSEFAVGDHVFGRSGFGANAEFICMRESAPLAHKPAGMTFEEAAAVCDGAILALPYLRRAKLRRGKKVLIYGASGSIGTAAVQLARYFDADVTAVCGTKNLELMKTLGADQVIDYQQEDFTKNSEMYDVIFDAVGKHSFRRSRDSLKSGGMYVPTDGWENLFYLLWTSRVGDRKVVFQRPPARGNYRSSRDPCGWTTCVCAVRR